MGERADRTPYAWPNGLQPTPASHGSWIRPVAEKQAQLQNRAASEGGGAFEL